MLLGAQREAAEKRHAVTMHRRLRAPVVVVLAVALLVVIGLQMTGAVALFPTRTSSAPAGSLGEGMEAGPVFPEPEPWTDVEWQAAVSNPLGPPDVLRRVDGVVAAGDLVLAWGRTPMPGRNQFNDMGAVFASVDGLAWRTIPVDHGVEAPNASTILGISAGPTGYLAVGSVCCEPERSALWHSADGLDWQRVELRGDFDPARTMPWRVAAAPGGWVILASSRVGMDAVLLFSEDGHEWEAVLTLAGGRHRVAASDVARTATGLVVVGTVEADGSYDGGVWHSVDGRHWDRLAADDDVIAGDSEVQFQRVVAHAGGLLVTGIEGTADQRQQCEQLLGMVASVGPVRDQPGADFTSCMPGEERAWTSADGGDWRVVGPAPGVAPIEFRVTVAGGPGLILLGETSAPASPDTALFTSADGAVWNVMDDGGPMTRDVAIGLVVRGRELLAITERWDGATTTLHVWRGRAN